MIEFVIYAGYAIVVCAAFAICGIALMAGLGHLMKRNRVEVEVEENRDEYRK